MHAEVGWYEDFNMKTIAYEANKRAEEKWRDHMRQVRRQQARYGGEFAYYDLVDIDRDRKPKETEEEIKAIKEEKGKLAQEIKAMKEKLQADNQAKQAEKLKTLLGTMELQEKNEELQAECQHKGEEIKLLQAEDQRKQKNIKQLVAEDRHKQKKIEELLADNRLKQKKIEELLAEDQRKDEKIEELDKISKSIKEAQAEGHEMEDLITELRAECQEKDEKIKELQATIDITRKGTKRQRDADPELVGKKIKRMESDFSYSSLDTSKELSRDLKALGLSRMKKKAEIIDVRGQGSCGYWCLLYMLRYFGVVAADSRVTLMEMLEERKALREFFENNNQFKDDKCWVDNTLGSVDDNFADGIYCDEYLRHLELKDEESETELYKLKTPPDYELEILALYVWIKMRGLRI